MLRRMLPAVVLGFIPAAAQTPALPQTYSFTANSNMMGAATISVHRHGSKEVIEMVAASRGLNLRLLYDFQAHRIYTVDRNANRCTTQEYTSAFAPPMHDPVGGAAEMLQKTAALPEVRREAVNGIPTRLVEANLRDGQGTYRFWLDDQFGFPVKQALVMGNGPERVLFEMLKIGYSAPAASLFTTPEGCTPVAGTTSATGGRAVMKVDAGAQGQARAQGQAQAAPAGDAKRLLGKWTFTARDGSGTQWSGTLTVASLAPDSFDIAKYSNECDLSLQSAKSGRGASGPCLYDPRTRSFSFAGGGTTREFSFTAVLSTDGKSLEQGQWVDARLGNGTWSAVSGSAR